MSDARWDDALSSARWAAHHFTKASRILQTGNFNREDDEAYVVTMGFFHAMQTGHTAVEEALVRVLQILEEDPPVGESWHAELIAQCATAAFRSARNHFARIGACSAADAHVPAPSHSCNGAVRFRFQQRTGASGGVRRKHNRSRAGIRYCPFQGRD